MNKTPIEWTNWSSNPFKARHKPIADALLKCPKCGTQVQRERRGSTFNLCAKISPGCANCYAATLTHRWGGPDYLTRARECFEPVLDEKELRRILRTKVKPGENRVFPHDMTDWMWEFWPDSFIDAFLNVVYQRQDLTFQMLTKRPERQINYISKSAFLSNAPLENLHLGVSCEDQKQADERIPLLLQTPAAVRWVSYEPALGPIRFGALLTRVSDIPNMPRRSDIDWVVVGGESGPGARPFDLQWALDTIAQCRAAGTACFVKQLGAQPIDHDDEGGLHLNIYYPHEGIWRLPKDKKGGDWSEWPEDLRVREFPEVAR